ncbi:HNH endonuclease domain-containing protein [Ekhidna sp.]
MYKPTSLDRNIIKQPWFNLMKPENAELLKWIWLDESDSIGVVEVDWDGFEKFTKGIVTKKDIDIVDFVHDCNNDGKERMRFLDRGRKIWFTPTVLFKHASNAGFRNLGANDRDASIMRILSQRGETRDWIVEQLIYNDRISINANLVNKVWNRKDATENEKELMERIAKHLNIKISKSGTSPAEIKKNYGNVCQYSGELCQEWELEIDHVLPRSNGHKDVNQWWNLVPCKKELNIKKGDKNVFQFIKEEGLELLPGVENAVKRWVKKGVLDYPRYYPNKRNKKEKLFTWDQVVGYVANNASASTSDYECVNPEDSSEMKRWRKKK